MGRALFAFACTMFSQRFILPNFPVCAKSTTSHASMKTRLHNHSLFQIRELVNPDTTWSQPKHSLTKTYAGDFAWGVLHDNWGFWRRVDTEQNCLFIFIHDNFPIKSYVAYSTQKQRRWNFFSVSQYGLFDRNMSQIIVNYYKQQQSGFKTHRKTLYSKDPFHQWPPIPVRTHSARALPTLERRLTHFSVPSTNTLPT